MSGDAGALGQAERDKLFHLSMDMLCVAGFDGYFKQINPAWSRVLGWSEAELLSFSWRDLVHPDDRRASREAGQALFAGTPSVCFENRHVCKDGSYRWLSWNAFPVVAEQKVFAVVRDITAQKAAEQGRAVLETRLRESQKLEALGTLAAGIAHDFNNILASVLGNAALAMEDVGADHPVAERLAQINKAGLRAGELVRQILAFGKNFSPELKPRPLRAIVDDALLLLASDLPAGVTLAAALSDEPLVAPVDAGHLQQVLIQLWRNACQSFHGHPGRIEVGLEPVVLADGPHERPGGLPAGAYARLWVADTGAGMDAATLTRIFEPFFTTRPVGQGTGLGLSAVHGIVSSHNGAVCVDSTPGLGTTAQVYLPLLAASAVSDPVRAVRAPAAEMQHVLYVDDDETVMVLMEALLQREGFRVTCHSDPAAALSAVRAEPQAFDLLITDFNMPAITGIALAANVARIRADLPVVILSGHISESVRAEAARLGVRSVVAKGGSVDELGNVVHRILGSLPN